MWGSDDRVRTARSLLLRAVESLGNGSTRPLETNSENTSPQLQLDASGGRGVQREPAYESAAISTPTSKATTSAVAERNRLFNFGFRHSSATPTRCIMIGKLKPMARLLRVGFEWPCLWIHCPNSPPHVKEGF